MVSLDKQIKINIKMADRGRELGGTNEKSSLGRNAKSYGSTCSPIAPRSADAASELFLRHRIAHEDTIQSIALKYGVTTADVRSANGLWSDNHICILDCLYIPLSKAAPEFRSSDQPGEIVTQHELVASRRHMPKSVSLHGGQMAACDAATPALRNGKVEASPAGSSSADKTAEVMSKDYFNKFDSSLAKIKDNLQKIEKTSIFLHDDDISRPSSRKKSSSLSLKSWTADVESLDPAKEPQLRFLSQSKDSQTRLLAQTSDPKIRQTLEHLEKTQDEMFQL